MRLHRFIGNVDCSLDRVEIVDEEIVNQIVRVLRLGVGDRVILGDGHANECIGEIIERHKDKLVVSVIERSVNANDPIVSAVLYCAILKRENFELVVQKATEIGVREIVPLITARTIKLDIKEDRLHKIVKEASEQSGRGRLPIVHAPMAFRDALVDARRNVKNLLFDIGDTITDASIVHGTASRGLFVGPEGGWTEEEVLAARDAGCEIVSFGKLTFRAETAAIVASYIGTRD